MDVWYKDAYSTCPQIRQQFKKDLKRQFKAWKESMANIKPEVVPVGRWERIVLRIKQILETIKGKFKS